MDTVAEQAAVDAESTNLTLYSKTKTARKAVFVLPNSYFFVIVFPIASVPARNATHSVAGGVQWYLPAGRQGTLS